MIGYGYQRGFRRVTRPKTVLCWGEEVVLGQVIVELLMDGPLYNFGDYRNNGNWPEVGWVQRIASFVNRVNEGVFPGLGYIRERYAGVDQIMQEHRADRVKRHTDHADGNAVLPARGRPAHAKHGGPQFKQCQGDRVSAQAPTRGSLQGR